MIGHPLTTAFSGLSFAPGLVAVMRDGARLVADVYTPDGPGPFPVLLMRQPYGRDIASTVVYAHPTWYARQGFIVVIQDVRGRGDSEGEFYPFRREEADGYDSVRWAATLPKSNGRVGMYGFSYQGSTQLLAALARPPELKALAPHMTAFDLYSGWFYRDGLLQLSTTMAWANQMLREDSRRRGAASTTALDECWTGPGRLAQAFPLRDARPITNGDLPTYGADWLRHPSADTYWPEFNLLNRIDELGLPMFHLSGWYDLYLRGSIDGYRAMAARHPHQFLLASPWVHLPWGNLTGGADFGPAAIPQVDAMMAAWFHHWLDHDTPGGACPLQGANYFTLGGNAWDYAPSWPPANVTPRDWFLQSDGRANSRFGDGRLAQESPGGPDDLFNYDPEVPVLAPGGNLGGMAAFGPHDLAAQQQGLNLLVYTSAPLAAPLRIAGAPTCSLHVRSSAPETAFVVRLSRVLPDGRATFLTLGATEVRADQTGTEIALTLDPIAVSFAAGERLRLDIASSAFPLLVRHPNTTCDPASVRAPSEYRRALQIVYHSTEKPSRLQLPVLSP